MHVIKLLKIYDAPSMLGIFTFPNSENDSE